MLHYLLLSLSFKPIEKCCLDLHHWFEWETVFCEKKPKMDEIEQKKNGICSIFVDSKLSQCSEMEMGETHQLSNAS